MLHSSSARAAEPQQGVLRRKATTVASYQLLSGKYFVEEMLLLPASSQSKQHGDLQEWEEPSCTLPGEVPSGNEPTPIVISVWWD